jgi:hypothetical protein
MVEAFRKHFTEAFREHSTEPLSRKAARQLFDKYLRNRLIDIWWDDQRGYVVAMRACAAIGNSFGADELSVAEAAAICGRSQQTIRNWAPHIGRFDQKVHRLIVSKARLAAYLRKRFGRVPSELEG